MLGRFPSLKKLGELDRFWFFYCLLTNAKCYADRMGVQLQKKKKRRRRKRYSVVQELLNESKMKIVPKGSYRRLLRRPWNTFVTRKYARCKVCVEVSRVHSWNRFLIFRISPCSAVEVVTLRNTKVFSRVEVDDEIYSLKFARENSMNCDICVNNSHMCTFFLWGSREMCLWLFCELSVAGLKNLLRYS